MMMMILSVMISVISNVNIIYELCGVCVDANGDDDDDDDDDNDNYADDAVVDSDDIRSSQGQRSQQGNLFDSLNLKKDLIILTIITTIITYHHHHHINTSQSRFSYLILS